MWRLNHVCQGSLSSLEKDDDSIGVAPDGSIPVIVEEVFCDIDDDSQQNHRDTESEAPNDKVKCYSSP